MAILGVAVLSAALACVAPTAPLPQLNVVTDSNSYLATRVESPLGQVSTLFTAIVRLENPSDVTVELERCGAGRPIFDIVRTDGRVSAYPAFWACTAPESMFELGPGETYVDTVFAQGSSGAALGGGAPILDGTHRIVYFGSRSLLRSNPFEVIVPE